MWISKRDYSNLKYDIRVGNDERARMWKRINEIEDVNRLLLERLDVKVFEESEKPKKKVLIKKAEYVKRVKERRNTNLGMYGKSISSIFNQQLSSGQQSGLYPINQR